MRFIQTWGEVTPSLFQRIQQGRLSRSISQPKLETILEEGCGSFPVQAPKRIVIFLPLLLSMILYFVLYKTIKDLLITSLICTLYMLLITKNRTTRSCLYNKTQDTADIIAGTIRKRRCRWLTTTFE
ncbi:unnamed protein product [Brassica oleracea]|uniref:(rape) hypothetical protein n=1 Tax=Brassica napus TaxID=3708 RepID=A0A816NAD4_BRANA|nr:unnamed protein product [Brassica napus]